MLAVARCAKKCVSSLAFLVSPQGRNHCHHRRRRGRSQSSPPAGAVTTTAATMSWFQTIQKGFKDAVDKTKEAGDRMNVLAKQALEKTKVAMLASLPAALAAAAESGDVARLKAEIAAFQGSTADVGGGGGGSGGGGAGGNAGGGSAAAAPGGALTLTDKDGQTVLHFACASGHAGVVQFLIDARVRPGHTTYMRLLRSRAVGRSGMGMHARGVHIRTNACMSRMYSFVPATR